MKKTAAFMFASLSLIAFSLTVFISLFALSSCSPTSSELDYSPYYSAKGETGTEVYCWKLKDDSWRSGALIGTDYIKSGQTIRQMQKELPCPLPKMKEILSTFSTTERLAVVVIATTLITSEDNVNYEYINPGNNKEIYLFLHDQLGLE